MIKQERLYRVRIDSITKEIAENNALLGNTFDFSTIADPTAYSYTDANGSTQTTDLQAENSKICYRHMVIVRMEM